jgi:DNA-binding transcriptional ArsR family regulator
MAATQKVTTDQILDALTARPGVSAAEMADALGVGQSTAAKHLAALESAGTARREPGGRQAGRRLPDRWTATAPATRAESNAGSSSGDRLSRGALGAMVRDYLAARPGEDLGPTQVAKGLGGKSSGAVGNALARLEAAGEARLVNGSPRRYRIVAKR